eukprot:403377303
MSTTSTIQISLVNPSNNALHNEKNSNSMSNNTYNKIEQVKFMNNEAISDSENSTSEDTLKVDTCHVVQPTLNKTQLPFKRQLESINFAKPSPQKTSTLALALNMMEEEKCNKSQSQQIVTNLENSITKPQLVVNNNNINNSLFTHQKYSQIQSDNKVNSNNTNSQPTIPINHSNQTTEFSNIGIQQNTINNLSQYNQSQNNCNPVVARDQKKHDTISFFFSHDKNRQLEAARKHNLMVIQARKLRHFNLQANKKMLINILTTYSYMPQYREAQFQIPKDFASLGFDHRIMSQQEVNSFIWTHKLIVPKQQNDGIANVQMKINQSYQNTLNHQQKVHNARQLLNQPLSPNSKVSYYQNANLLDFSNNSSIKQLNEKQYKEQEGSEKSDSTELTFGDYQKDQQSQNDNEYSSQIKQTNHLNMSTSENGQQKMVGQYTLSERSKRILKYKEKVQKRRQICKLSKKFNGRSRVATNKVRVNGRFVKAQKQITNEHKNNVNVNVNGSGNLITIFCGQQN